MSYVDGKKGRGFQEQETKASAPHPLTFHSRRQLFFANCSHCLLGSLESSHEMSSFLHSLLSHMSIWKEQPQP